MIEQVRHVFDLALDDSGHLQHLRRDVRRACQQCAGHADRCQRVAQFVRQHCQKLVLALVARFGVLAQTRRILFEPVDAGQQRGLSGGRDARSRRPVGIDCV